MNQISFNNFNGFDPPQGFFPETEEPAEDFSAILTNIVTTLQPGDSSLFAPEPEKPEIKGGIELPPCDQPTVGKKNAELENPLTSAAENNFLEIPPAMPKLAATENFEQIIEADKFSASAAALTSSTNTEDATTATEKPTAGQSLPEKAESAENPSLDSLWAGTHAGIRQRINDYKFEETAKASLNTQIKNLFLAEPARVIKNLSKFKANDEIPANLFPELGGAPTDQKAASQTSSLFQAQTSVPLQSRILKFEKPADVGIINNSNSKDYLPTTIETPTSKRANNNILKPPVRVDVTNDQNIVPAPLPAENQPQISEIAQTGKSQPLGETRAENPLPRVERGKIKGFDITRSEVSTILRTFDNFFKSKPSETIELGGINLGSEVKDSESFEEIAQSIKDSFAAVMKPAEKGFEAKITPTDEPGNLWWDGKKTADGNGKIDTDRIQSTALTPLKTSAQTTEFGAPQTFNKAENPANEDFRNSADFTFDRFMENVSKDKFVFADLRATDIEAARVIEQINPHLLELAALTEKNREKQILKMRLHPAELGAVEITIEKSNSGALNAYFQTETDGARQALSQNIEQLRDTLQQAGWQVGQMEISTGAGSSNAGQQRDQNARQSAPVEDFNFSRNSNKPYASEQKSHNRLLSLLA